MREIKKIVFTRWESDFNIKINRNRNEIQCDAVTKVVERKYQQQNSEETKIRIFESHDLNWIHFLYDWFLYDWLKRMILMLM